MKRAFQIFALLAALLFTVSAMAQRPIKNYTWYEWYGKHKFKDSASLGLPMMAPSAPDSGDTYWDGEKLWIWAGTWKSFATDTANNFTTNVIFDLLTGNLTTSRYGLSDIVTPLDGRYMLLSDSGKYFRYTDTTDVFSRFMQNKDTLIFQYPFVRNGRYVNLDYHAPIYNSQFVQSIHQQPGTPMHGMTWVYDSTKVEWRHGFITPDGTVIPGIDSVWIANDSLYTVKGSDTTAQFIGYTATDISNWNTAYSWGNHATVGYLTNITGLVTAGTNVTIDGTGTAGDPYLINAAGGGFTNTDETDETALAQTISVNQGNGVTILGSPTQTLGGTPSWTINADVTTADVYADNLLVQPGYVTWSGTGLTFDVTAATYDIAHVRYSSAAGQITLDAADATNPRIDVIAVDNTGAIVKITGTAEANPVQPQIDPSTQVLLTSILLPAGATTPYGVSDEVIYDENTEWTSAAGGLTANFDNATNNYNGSKSAAISGFSNGQYVQWTDTALNAAANQVLSMQVRLSSNWNNSNNASVMLMRGAVPISQSLLVTNYGLVKSNSGGYQTVSIPITAFSPTDSFDRVRVSFMGNSGNTVNIDYVRLQSGVTTVGPVQDIHVIGATFTGTTLSIATSDGKTYTTTINAGAATDTYVNGVNYSGDVLTVTMNTGATYTTTIAASGGTSTHTVTLSMPSAFNVTSPITNGGTLTVTGAGTDTQTITGTGSLVNNKGVSNFQTSGSTYTLTLVDGTTYTGTVSGGGSSTQSKSWTIESPTSTESLDLFYTDTEITVTKVAEMIVGSSSPSVTYNILYSSNRSSGTKLWTTNRVASSTTGATTTSFDNATIPAGSFVWLETYATTGTVVSISPTLIAQ